MGINTNLVYDTRDNPILPQKGVLWNTEAKWFNKTMGNYSNYVKLSSFLSMYLSFNKDPRTVFAFRFGGAYNYGDYEFFHSNLLGGHFNLRGYRKNRFAGDACVFQNSEMRIKLLNFRNPLFNGPVGLIGFNDIGRVWCDNESSDKWHNGYGGGIWVAPFKMAALSLTYNLSVEEKMMIFMFRFMI